MVKKNLKEWQELRRKLLENYLFYRDACEIDGVAVWPKNMAKFMGVSERIAEYWLKGTRTPSSKHLAKLKQYYGRLEPFPELPEESKEYLAVMLARAEGTLKSLKAEL